MITYVPITDPEQAHELFHLGLLLWKDPYAEVYVPADSGWSRYGPKDFPTMRYGLPFFIRVEE